MHIYSWYNNFSNLTWHHARTEFGPSMIIDSIAGQFDIITDKLVEYGHNLNKYLKQVIKWLKIMIKQNYFKFNNNIYYQLYGVMMGDPKASFLSRI